MCKDILTFKIFSYYILFFKVLGTLFWKTTDSLTNSNSLVLWEGDSWGWWEFLDNVNCFIKVNVPDTPVELCFHKARDFIDVAMLLVKSEA